MFGCKVHEFFLFFCGFVVGGGGRGIALREILRGCESDGAKQSESENLSHLQLIYYYYICENQSPKLRY
jgi:hypothetical protein